VISSIQLVEYLAEQYFFLITGLTVIFILFPLLDRPCLFPFFLLKKMTFYNAFLNQTLRSLPRTAKNYSRKTTLSQPVTVSLVTRFLMEKQETPMHITWVTLLLLFTRDGFN
jgi:hypothetical protein